MNSYEGMFILKPDLTKENLDKTVGQVRETFTKHKGSLADFKEWGKLKLAYPIKKHKEGLYYLANFQMDNEAVVRLKRDFSLNESILRVLLVRA